MTKQKTPRGKRGARIETTMKTNLTASPATRKVCGPTKAEIRANAAKSDRRESPTEYAARMAKWRAKLPNRPKKQQANGRVFLYVPAAYDHAKMPPNYRRRENDVHYFLSRIVEGQEARHHDRAGYVNLTAKLLRKYIAPRHQKKLIKMLINEGVVECERTAVAGRKAYAPCAQPRTSRNVDWPLG